MNCQHNLVVNVGMIATNERGEKIEVLSCFCIAGCNKTFECREIVVALKE